MLYQLFVYILVVIGFLTITVSLLRVSNVYEKLLKIWPFNTEDYSKKRIKIILGLYPGRDMGVMDEEEYLKKLEKCLAVLRQTYSKRANVSILHT